MADEEGKEEKQLQDFSAEVKVKVPQYIEPVRNGSGSLDEALDKLLSLEKKTRLAADGSSTKEIAVAIITLLHDLKKWQLLNEHITMLCKRRAQLRQVVQAIVQTATVWIDGMPTKELKRELITTLRAVSLGKIFVEVERARMTRTLAQLEEEEGRVSEAAEILHDVQVETIGSMEIREKANFLLEQLRLILAKKDFIRSELVANKVNTSVLDKPEMQDLKLKYYNLMIQFHSHSNNYLAICKAYRAIFETPSIQADPAQWKSALKSAVIFLVLAPFDSEVSDLLHRVKTESKIAELPSYKTVLELFTTDELIRWPLDALEDWKTEAVFQGEEGQKKFADLHKRIVQHNIRVIALYYHRIRTERLAELLSLSEGQAEEHLSELVSSQQLFAKIDRPARIVTFTKKQTPNSLLNNWSHSISQLLTLIENTCHLINKENMLHNVDGGGGSSSGSSTAD